MKFIKKLSMAGLSNYKDQKFDDAYFGFGIIRAKDYEREKFGHLIFWSMNIGKLKFIKKFFVYF